MITTTVSSADDWSAVDAEKFADFLSSDTGRRFLVKLVDQIPPLLEGGHVNKVLIRSGEVRGQTNLIQYLQILAHPIALPSAPVDSLPPLEDDRLWPEDEAEVKTAPKE